MPGARCSAISTTFATRPEEDLKTVRWTVFPTTLSVKRRRGRKRARGTRTPMPQAARPNARWSLDFLADNCLMCHSSSRWLWSVRSRSRTVAAQENG
ncbi:hypothetical protein E2974_00405 (plasmid) [Paracoccus yeei]